MCIRDRTHPINLRRNELGEFHHLYHELRNDNQKFFEYLCMSVGTFDLLLEKLHLKIQKMDTNYRESIQPVERLVVTLR